MQQVLLLVCLHCQVMHHALGLLNVLTLLTMRSDRRTACASVRWGAGARAEGSGHGAAGLVPPVQRRGQLCPEGDLVSQAQGGCCHSHS